MFLKNIVRRKVEQIPDELGALSPLLQRILAARGVSSTQELDYSLANLADYRLLSNIEQGVEALISMIESNAKVVIVGDFDADGATSTALLMLALPTMGLKNLSYVVPNRFEYGYGLSEKIVEEVAKLAPDWIITVDNGISNHGGVALAQSLGIKVLITDHHLPGDTLPQAEVIINPNLPGDRFPSKALAGVGVAFYLLIALRSALRQGALFQQWGLVEPNLAEWLDIVALGTVADVVPLDRNNRILVAQGLERIRAGCTRPGIKLLLQAGKRDFRKVQASDLGFAVGPRLNAAGRLEDMSIGIECLLAESEAEAAPMAFELDSLNQYRREIEQDMVTDALTKLMSSGLLVDGDRPNSLCLYDDQWHQGVVGLVASRIKEKLNRPIIAFAKESDTEIKGSGRSVPGVHMRDVLANIATKQPHLLSKFGGHAMAAGLTIQLQHFEAFKQAFESEVESWLGHAAFDDTIVSDGTLCGSELRLETAYQIKQLGPWGQAFPEPLFDGVFDVIQKRVLSNKHLKLLLKDPQSDTMVDAIQFFANEELLALSFERVEIVYKIDINDYRGETALQLMIEQIRIL
jgi:single-stranded-DNA-specific exonuclease